jgi:SNF2 family DNA or RNA helicase
VLTGTPVENAVRDVWSLMHFLMPGYLGTRADFKERYEQPVSQEPGGPEHRRMIQRLAPFVLRRTKKAVDPELPDKIEQVVCCELSGAQREAYGKLVDLSRREVSKAEGLKNQGQARMLMLTALLRLRQACNDLRLLGEGFAGGLEPEAAKESGKLEALDELLTEALGGEHRVLLFSQFSSMLDLLQAWLEERGVAFCRLDGSTRDRSAQVDRFQTGTVPVFLISLKAGGVGLNLTAADTVVQLREGDVVTVPLRVDLRGDLMVRAVVVSSHAVSATREGFAWRLHGRFLPLDDRDRQRLASYLFRREMIRHAPLAA